MEEKQEGVDDAPQASGLRGEERGSKYREEGEDEVHRAREEEKQQKKGSQNPAKDLKSGMLLLLLLFLLEAPWHLSCRKPPSPC